MSYMTPNQKRTYPDKFFLENIQSTVSYCRPNRPHFCIICYYKMT